MSRQTIEEFVDRMGLAAEADGLPRIAGRIFGFFVLEGGTHSFSEIAEKLEVSRGSVSSNVRILESLGVIERTIVRGDRQDYFRLTADPYGQMLEGHVERMRRIEGFVKTTRDAIAKSNSGARGRLQEMALFYQTAADNTESILDQWHKRLDKRKRA